MKILYTLLIGLAFGVLWRTVWYFIKLRMQNNKYYPYILRVLPVLELMLIVAYVFWIVRLFFSMAVIYPVILGTMAVILILWFSWFVFRDVLAGTVIKAEFAFKPGLFIKTHLASGTIKSIGYTSIELQTGGGELVKIPYSVLRNHPIWRQEDREQGKPHTLIVRIPSKHGAQNIQRLLKRKLLELPWVLVDSEIQVSITTEGDCYMAEVSFQTVYQEMLPKTEEILSSYVKEELPGC